MIKKLIYIFSSLIFFIFIIYVAAGFYLANTILKIEFERTASRLYEMTIITSEKE